LRFDHSITFIVRGRRPGDSPQPIFSRASINRTASNMRKKTWATVHDLDRIGELFDRGRHAFPLSE